MAAALLLALLALAGANPLAAQAIRFGGGPRPADVGAAIQRGYPAYPATALRALGAEVAPLPRGARAVLLGDTLDFEALSPFFFAGGEPFQLVHPVYREGGILYLPRQFFTEWLPGRYPGRLAFRDGVLRLDPVAAKAADSVAAGQAGDPRARTEPPRAPARAGDPAPPETAPGGDRRVVIIDPGHGGRDPGKVGPNGLREKDVALAVARKLASLLRERGYEVHLTREHDTLIALADRPRMANRWKNGRPATLFLSLHANAGPARAEGFETFFLSEARTEDERRVAEMENAAEAYEEEAGGTLPAELDQVLNTLRNDFYLRASNDLAEVVQQRLANFHPGPDRGVKQAGFRVLVGAFMPAVLVEIAFISNRKEANLLGTSAFQQKVAWGLVDAVEYFFDTHGHLLGTEVSP